MIKTLPTLFIQRTFRCFIIICLIFGNYKLFAQPTLESHASNVGKSVSAMVNLPASTAVNNLLIVGLMFEKGSDMATITPPAGWQLETRINESNNFGMAIYYK